MMKGQFKRNRKAVKGIIRKKNNEDILLNKMFTFMTAEKEAFEKAGITLGRVTFTCPLCGGEAVGNRYQHESLDGYCRVGGFGSGCTKCGFRHS